jgi:hypothetical protein
MTGGFQMKLAFTINFIKTELEGWDFLASAPLLRARVSPTRSRESGTDLPPVTPEESQGMPSSLYLPYFSVN